MVDKTTQETDQPQTVDVQVPEGSKGFNWGAIAKGAGGVLSEEAGKFMKKTGVEGFWQKAKTEIAGLTDGADDKLIDAAAKAILAATEKKEELQDDLAKKGAGIASRVTARMQEIESERNPQPQSQWWKFGMGSKKK
jgi:hypothetical protein